MTSKAFFYPCVVTRVGGWTLEIVADVHINYVGVNETKTATHTHTSYNVLIYVRTKVVDD